MKHLSFDATTSALDAKTLAIARSYRQFWHGVSGNIGDCGVGITPQMCNRVTNHGDMSTFSKPDPWLVKPGLKMLLLIGIFQSGHEVAHGDGVIPITDF